MTARPDSGRDRRGLQTPWTLTSLGQVALSSVSNVGVICRSAVQVASDGFTSQAIELTGSYQGQDIHAIVVLSLLPRTQSDFYVGEIRSIYTPASQWSAGSAATLWLINKHAIESPQE